jgi:hypothetical protein
MYAFPYFKLTVYLSIRNQHLFKPALMLQLLRLSIEDVILLKF